jgi:hypothetical protein
MMITAHREAVMSERQQQRVDAIIAEYHNWKTFMPDYQACADGSQTQIDLSVADDRAERAASELRACGFVVTVKTEAAYEAEPMERPPSGGLH